MSTPLYIRKLEAVANAAKAARKAIEPVYTREDEFVYIPRTEWRDLVEALDALRRSDKGARRGNLARGPSKIKEV